MLRRLLTHIRNRSNGDDPVVRTRLLKSLPAGSNLTYRRYWEQEYINREGGIGRLLNKINAMNRDTFRIIQQIESSYSSRDAFDRVEEAEGLE